MGRTAKVWVHLHDEIDALHEQKHGSSKIARILIEKHGLGEDNLNALRLYVSRRYAPKGHEALSEECESLGIPVEDVNHYWHKGKHFSIHAKNSNEIDYSSVFKEILEAYEPVQMLAMPERSETCQKAIKATITDAHVGLEPDPDNSSLFDYEYNEGIFKANLDKVFASIIKECNLHGRFDLLLIDDLGDGLDGWNGFTTRGGHQLDQNMTNTEAFKAYVLGKLNLIEKCIRAGVANKVMVRSVANCNHAGDFGEVANLAIQMMLERSYGPDVVEFYILKRFMEHFEYGNHTFILTHGKDKKHMKRGLPIKLDEQTKNFINSYIEHYEIRTKYIHLEKGDLHQVSYQRTKRFDYRNYMSFAPPSAYSQHNFEDGYSGYSIQVVPKYSNEISHTDYYFELKKTRKVA